jgi:hypothetical protein
MASITTILGTDSVSSSRIVINNNFAALNQELADISTLFNTTAQTLTLTGLITGGTLKVNNGTIDTFKVNNADADVNVPINFNQDVIINKGLMHSVYYNATTLPGANAYDYTTYVLDATAPAFASPVSLAAADQGQEITLIANGGDISINGSNVVGTTSIFSIYDGGSITLRWIDDISSFFVISSYNTSLIYASTNDPIV